FQIIEENTNALFEHFDSKINVDAVIYDFDFNSNYVQLQKALWCLQNNPDCIFLVTLNDKTGPTGPRGCILGEYGKANTVIKYAPGPNIFVETLKNLSGKNFIQVGKPSETCVNFIKEMYHVIDPKRVLFVGDSIESDMSTGAIGGFQKMLVLTGSTKIEEITDWKFPEEYKPEFYVESLDVLNKIIKSIFPDL
uniref:Phosphoglycolate phosphatase 2-like n=1 Tax=Diabrotica virgifera virgifera TaxID=50390 RepID=A0A6P7GVF2_DIAVI